MKYDLLYRLGLTPWERYGPAAAASISGLLDREDADRRDRPASRPGRLGRALDVGCGRGQYVPELSRRGWEVVGVDRVARAITAANRKAIAGAHFVVADVTDLPAAGLGTFDLFLDVGCFQGLGPAQRLAVGPGITELANPEATILMLAFQRTRLRAVLEGVTQAEVTEAFPGWELVATKEATTAGLGWPMSRTSPRWYRLRRSA